MGLADGLGLVLSVQASSAGHAGIDVHAGGSIHDGLAAAVDAAAGASHDFHEVVGGFTGLDLLDQLLGSAGGVGDGHLQVQAADGHFSFLHTLDAAQGLVLHVLHAAALEPVSSGTQGSFHDTAGRAEDGSRTGGLSHQLVEALFVGQLGELDAGRLDHAGQLTGGDGDIHSTHAVQGHLGTGGLELLGGAGHHSHDHDLLGIHAGLLSPVGLDDGAFHLHGRLAGGQVGDQLGEVVLAVLDPSGRAGGEHGQGAAVLDAVHQLGGLLHDGQVSREVGIEDLVEAQTLQGLGHLAGHAGADGHAELLAQGNADSGGGLHDHDLLRIGDGGPHLGGVVLLSQGAHGAGVDALAAEDAVGLHDVAAKGGSDLGLEATLHSADGADLLHLTAGSQAAAAQDALVGIAHDGGGEIVQRVVDVRAAEAVLIGAQLLGQLLQLAVLAADAGEALALVVGQDQLQHGLAGRADSGGVGLDDHALGHGHHAGSGQGAGAHVHHTHTAGADLVDVLEVAQGGNMDVGLTGSFQDGGTGRNADLHAINRNVKHIHYKSISFRSNQPLVMAPNLHFSIQAPHLRHLELSMTWGSRTLPLMQLAGQLRAHRVQPLHLSGSIL